VRKEPKSLTFDQFADELLAERQPRALVILASAQIDTQLRTVIEGFLWPKSGKPKAPDELFDGDSPLSTFSSRIKVALRLGIIDERLADALDKLRDVRNQAAHWISFGVAESPLRDQLKYLQSLIAGRRSYQLTVSKFFSGASLNDLESLQAVLLTMSVLLGSIQTTMPERSLPSILKPNKLD
jgi:hypothetical protein